MPVHASPGLSAIHKSMRLCTSAHFPAQTKWMMSSYILAPGDTFFPVNDEIGPGSCVLRWIVTVVLGICPEGSSSRGGFPLEFLVTSGALAGFAVLADGRLRWVGLKKSF